jgi:hypothetical protein
VINRRLGVSESYVGYGNRCRACEFPFEQIVLEQRRNRLLQVPQQSTKEAAPALQRTGSPVRNLQRRGAATERRKPVVLLELFGFAKILG